MEVSPGYWSGMPSEDGEVPSVELAESTIRMHPLFDPAVLGASLCGRLVSGLLHGGMRVPACT